MKRQSSNILAMLGMGLGLGLGAGVQAYGQANAIVAIDYPGATGTQAWGINPRGDIVGVYTLADKSTRGFLLRDGVYSSIDFPGAAATYANSINPQGDVVGEYGLTATGAHHSFLLSDGKYTTIDYPGATSTSATGINSRGEIAGLYTAANNSTHAFLLAGDKFTTVDYPGATLSLANGISPAGDVIGSYVLAGVSYAYIWSNGRVTSFNYPGASGFSNATTGNARGDIVGRYRGADNQSHGYVMSDGKFTTVDVPGATFTGLTGITPAGDIIGRQTTAGVNHGFLMRKQAGRYAITDLGPMGAVGQPMFVSDSGAVSGAASVADGSTHGFLWRKGVRKDLGTMGIGIANSWASVVNDRGQAVGQSEIWSTDPHAEDFCGFKALGLPAWGSRCLPFLWQDGVMTALSTLGGNNGAASWINAKGDVVGYAETASADPGCPAPQRLQFKPVMWQNGKIQELPTVGGDPAGVAIAINDRGQSVGASGNCSAFSPQLLFRLQPLHATMWQNGKATDLGTLGGTGHAFGNVALAINQQGQVTGNSDLRGDAANHAFFWTKEKGMQDLGTLPGDVISAGIGINDRGDVVGVSLDAAFNLRAYRWQNGKLEDLNALVEGDSSLYLMLPVAINNAGEIVGLAFDTVSHELHGFLAAPKEASGAKAAETASRTVELTDDHRRLIQQQLGFWRMGRWLAPPR